MRLICPKCDAQYEVPQDVIPSEGRDVQCSNCGKTWYQQHPDHVQKDADGNQPDVADNAIEDDENAVGAEDAQQDKSVLDQDGPDVRPAPSRTDVGAPVRRELDPAVAEVLRAEAELEAQARRRENIESQPDLGLPEAPKNAKPKPQERKTRTAAVSEDETTPASPKPASSRRDLLPDIEEINSTLRANSDRSAGDDPGQTAQRELQEKRSSRWGFYLTICVIAVFTLAYVYSPQLIKAVPEAEPALTTYVSTVDQWRQWLDEQIADLLTKIDALLNT